MNIWSRFRRLPLAVRAPLAVVLFMIVVSAVISERVLDHLSRSQSAHLQGLAGAYMDAVAASVIPSLLREDSWEIFDVLERMKPQTGAIRVVETVVTDPNDVVLASTDPGARPTLSKLAPSFLDRFPREGVAIEPDSAFGLVAMEIGHQQQQVGRIRAIFDVTALLAERRQVLATLLATNTALTIALAVVGFATVRRMVRPMQVLETHMLEAADGKPTLIAAAEHAGANPEAARLYDAYNALVRSENQRKELARQLAREENLASLGRLASGMAHEINNPLGGLMNAVDTLRRHGHEPKVRSRSIEIIHRGLEGIRDVVQAALATYRPERLSRPLRPEDLEDVVALVGSELRRKRQTIEFRVDGHAVEEAGLPAGPLRQAVLNLLLNACSATPEGGRLSLVAAGDGADLALEISDEGGGLPPEAARLLLEQDIHAPPGEAGLGLWVVRQIARETGMRIVMDRRDGKHCIRLLAERRPSEGYDHAA